MQDSLVTNNFSTVNPIVTKLRSQMHLGTFTLRCCQGSHAKVKGHLRSNLSKFTCKTPVTNNFATVIPIMTKFGSQMDLGNLRAVVPSGVTC